VDRFFAVEEEKTVRISPIEEFRKVHGLIDENENEK
jgi:hypothetical protein